MYYSISVDHNDMAVHLTRSERRVLRSAVCPVEWMRLTVVCCGMAVKRKGMLAASVRKMKALTVKMETVTLIGKDR
jgi:hypothetical protein